MRPLYLLQVFRSHYCQLVFGASLVLGYFVVPKKIFYGYDTILGILFILSFALVMTCLVRQTKERVKAARTYSGAIIGIIATAIGLTALEACGVGAPVCGAMVGVGVLSVILPMSAVDIIGRYAVPILIGSIVIQLIALYFMNCFKRTLGIINYKQLKSSLN